MSPLRSFSIVLVLGLPVCIGSSGCSKEADATSIASPILVTTKSMSYDPKKLEIRVGDSVAWTNSAHTKHTATSDDEGKTFDTGEVEPGKISKSVKFDKAGEFTYHCSIHGKSMNGSIVVKTADSKPGA